MNVRLPAYIVVFTLAVGFLSIAPPPVRAAPPGKRTDESNAAVIEALLDLVREGDASRTVELLSSVRIENEITGHTYTVIKVRVGQDVIVAQMNESTRRFATGAGLPRREALALLDKLPPVYRKLGSPLARTVRRLQGGALGGGQVADELLRVTFYTDSADGLDRIAQALGDISFERIDFVARFAENPPIIRPGAFGPGKQTVQAPNVRVVAAELSLSDMLRVGAIPAVKSIEPTTFATARLDVSVPRIHADQVHNLFIYGDRADIAIVDSGIDDTHPDLDYVILEMDFRNSSRFCLGGANNNIICVCRPPGACVAGVCVGGLANGKACVAGCPGGVCENTEDDNDGHGTHVAGIAGNSSLSHFAVAPLADLINAKAIPSIPGGTVAALAFSRNAGADVINGSYGVGSSCTFPANLGACLRPSICTAPPANLGNSCFYSFECDGAAGPGDGQCESPWTSCMTHTDCDVPAGAGNGFCWPGQSPLRCFRPGVCTAPPVNVGRRCNLDNHCDSVPGAGDGYCVPTLAPCANNAVCDAPGNPGSGLCVPQPFDDIPCVVNADCQPPSVVPPVGVCFHTVSDGKSRDSLDVDFEVFANNITVVIAAEEVPFTAVCSNNPAIACANNTVCLSGGGVCQAIASTPNDAFNVITVGASATTAPASTPAAFSQFGPTLDSRSKPDVLAPGDGAGGDSIDSTAHDWESAADFVGFAGTSMAAPHVAGLVALLFDWGSTHGISTDTPYIKAVIINNCDRLAGWASPGDKKPLDPQQGAGEIDAIQTFHAYADDRRVWQQIVTNIAPSGSHWYWFDVTGALETVVVTLVIERHVTNPAAVAPNLSDLDIRLFGPNCNQVDVSRSMVDSVEHIVFTPANSGRYVIEVDPVMLAVGGSEFYALAAGHRLEFLGTTKPCGPDFGDAPDPFTGAGMYPTLLVSNGARHLDWTKEWLGTSRPEIDGELAKVTLAVRSRVDPFPSVSGEADADDPSDPDGAANLIDSDLWDDGMVVVGDITPEIPFDVRVTVQANINLTGFGPTGRYDAAVAAKRLYLNAWADWNGDGDWSDPGEKIIGTGSATGQVAVDPATFGMDGRFTVGEVFVDANGSGRWEPGESFTDVAGHTSDTLTFPITPPADLALEVFARFRLDYGEDAGNVANVDGSLSGPVGAAQYGEVEDYSWATNACNAGAGDCCSAHDTPGCRDEACCDLVCNEDVFCCEVSWNAACVEAAGRLCGDTCHDCCETGGPGCDDLAVAACVCADSPACCDVAWTAACVTLVASLGCDNCGGCGDGHCDGSIGENCTSCSPDCGTCHAACPSTQFGANCFQPVFNQIGCPDENCCNKVCTAHPECCGDIVKWDTFCAGWAFDLCTVCGDVGAGTCCAATGTKGCSDDGCCRSICRIFPNCCLDEWDSVCGGENQAHLFCNCPFCGDGVCNSAGGEDCSTCLPDCPCPPGATCDAGSCVECTRNEECVDSVACTVDECIDGLCVNTPDDSACSDMNPCTDDVCSPATGCANPNNTDPCNDGDACTTDDACSGGTCVGGASLSCDDDDECTIDDCDPVLGCVYAVVDCNDDLFCTGFERCQNGLCQATGNPCIGAGIACDDGLDSCICAPFVGSGSVPHFVDCVSGPEIDRAIDCVCPDWDQDSDVDLIDYAAFQRAFSFLR